MKNQKNYRYIISVSIDEGNKDGAFVVFDRLTGTVEYVGRLNTVKDKLIYYSVLMYYYAFYDVKFVKERYK